MLPHCRSRETEREGLIVHSSSFFIVENLLHELGESYDEVILVGLASAQFALRWNKTARDQ